MTILHLNKKKKNHFFSFWPLSCFFLSFLLSSPFLPLPLFAEIQHNEGMRSMISPPSLSSIVGVLLPRSSSSGMRFQQQNNNKVIQNIQNVVIRDRCSTSLLMSKCIYHQGAPTMWNTKDTTSS